MAKKPKSKPQKSNMLLAAAIAAIVVAGLIGYAYTRSGTDSGLVATLSPALFTGRVQAAYQAAKDAPEVLAEMPCYCGCDRLGHWNNLYCFVDDHGSHCEMCMAIAIESRDMHNEGMAIASIRDAIRAKYAMYAP